MNIEVQSQKAINISSDILVLGFFNEMAPPKGLAGEMDWILNNSLSLLIKNGKITGRFGEVVLVSSGRTRTSKIFWVGLGKREEFNHSKILNFAPDLFLRLEKLGVKEAYLDLWDIEGCQLDFSSALNAFLNGIFQNKKESKSIISGGIEPGLRRPPDMDMKDKSGISGFAGMERGGTGGIEPGLRRPPDMIDLTFHTRDRERIKELNRFLKEIDLKSRVSVGARG